MKTLFIVIDYRDGENSSRSLAHSHTSDFFFVLLPMHVVHRTANRILLFFRSVSSYTMNRYTFRSNE
jgi:hypothetical protein